MASKCYIIITARIGAHYGNIYMDNVHDITFDLVTFVAYSDIKPKHMEKIVYSYSASLT